MGLVFTKSCFVVLVSFVFFCNLLVGSIEQLFSERSPEVLFKQAVCAVVGNNRDLFFSTLERGLDPNSTFDNGMTLLMWLVSWGRDDLVEHFLKFVDTDTQKTLIDIYAKDHLGRDALFYARYFKQKGCQNLLKIFFVEEFEEIVPVRSVSVSALQAPRNISVDIEPSLSTDSYLLDS